ncbi:MAG: alpha/beta fold hydrolase, partial [Alphaproteobacteria bacterium]|nr:alpha/beta fold hydrolase [Alphaproteobacteria bacterium]
MNARPAGAEFEYLQHSAPSNELVEKLCHLWAKILQAQEVGPDSDFFELGGDSLTAITLLIEIEREFGIRLPVTVIYDAPTVAQQAELICSDATPEFSPLVQLKPGAGRPLFIVHGFGGTVFELAPLGRQIAWKGPVYAIQARGIDGREPPLTSVEQMASLYLSAVKEVQPQGPYLLAGYSFGGLIAFEMARLARAANDKVGLLLLIDSYPHPAHWPSRARRDQRRRKFAARARRAATHPLEALRQLRARVLKPAAAPVGR